MRFWRGVVGTVVSVAVLAGGLDVVPAPAIAAAVSSPVVEPVSDPAAPPAMPSGDFSSAPSVERAAGQGRASFDPARSKVVPALTTERRRVFENADGTFTTEIAAGPARVLGADGAWRENDLTLSRGGDGRWRPRVSPTVVAVADESGGELATAAVDGGGEIAVSVDNAAEGRRAVVGRDAQGLSRARFAPVLDGGVAVEVAPIVDGVKTTYELPARSSAGRSLVERLRLPAGWSAFQDGPSVALVDGAGAVRGAWVGGIVEDANPRGAMGFASLELLNAGTQTAVARVVIDPVWLGDPGRVFPVRVDPTVVTKKVSTTGGWPGDTMVNDAYPTYSYWAATELQIGRRDGVTNDTRSLVVFDVAGSKPAGATTLSAYLGLYETASLNNGCYSSEAVGRRPVAGWGSTTTWSNQPAADGSDEAWTGWNWYCPDATNQNPNSWVQMDVKAYYDRWLNGTLANNGVMVLANDEEDPEQWKKFSAAERGVNIPKLTITYSRPPGKSLQTEPVNGAVVATATPTFKSSAATDADGDAVKYWFRVATSPDGESGSVLNSGWLTSPQWTPPAGSLQDGVSYWWHVWTWDGSVITDPQQVWSLRVDQRLGADEVAPSDTAGPVSVNLATGNVFFSTSGPSFPAVGGAMGATFSTTPRRRRRQG